MDRNSVRDLVVVGYLPEVVSLGTTTVSSGACALATWTPGTRIATQHKPQHRPQHANCSAQAAKCFVYVRAIAFMFIHTQHANEIAGNSIALLMEIQKKLKYSYVQLGAACGPLPADCGLRQSMYQSRNTFKESLCKRNTFNEFLY